MSIIFNETAAPSTPAAGKQTMFYDSSDQKTKCVKDEGYTSTLSNDGLQDRSVIINGGMMIQQKVAAASTAILGISTTTRAGVVADRWAVTTSVASNLNWAQIDSATTQETGLVARFYGSIISATAGKKVMLSQFIFNSAMASLRGKQCRLAVKTNQKVGTAGQTYRLGLLYLTAAGTTDTCPTFLTGAWSASTGVDPAWAATLLPITPDANTPVNGTIAGNYLNINGDNVWQNSSCTFTIPATAKNLIVVLFADATGGTTDNLSVSEFQLTVGPELVDYVQPPMVEDLMRCMRYYQKSFPYAVVPAASVAVATGGFGSMAVQSKAGSGAALAFTIPVDFKLPMKTNTPTITLFTPVGAGAVVYRHNGTTPAIQGTTAVLASSTTDRGCIVTATAEATANGVAGDLGSIHWTASCEPVA
jgi:hypothetical protein